MWRRKPQEHYHRSRRRPLRDDPGFVDVAHANDLQKRRSTTGVVFTFMGGAVVHKSKTQSLTASSSTEAEFIAAHAAAKIARYLRMLLNNLVMNKRILLLFILITYLL